MIFFSSLQNTTRKTPASKAQPWRHPHPQAPQLKSLPSRGFLSSLAFHLTPAESLTTFGLMTILAEVFLTKLDHWRYHPSGQCFQHCFSAGPHLAVWDCAFVSSAWFRWDGQAEGSPCQQWDMALWKHRLPSRQRRKPLKTFVVTYNLSHSPLSTSREDHRNGELDLGVRKPPQEEQSAKWCCTSVHAEDVKTSSPKAAPVT